MDKNTFLSRFSLFTQEQDITSKKSNERILKHHKPLKKAAVLIPLVISDDGINVIFTERALHLRHHPGQVSFPGGKHENSDDDTQHTALRETEEEIGILQTQVNVIGKLPCISTISGFTVTPYLGFVDNQYNIVIDKQEVRSVFQVPLSYLLNRNNFHKQYLIANKQRNYTYCIAYQNRLIWGATAQIIFDLQTHLNHRI